MCLVIAAMSGFEQTIVKMRTKIHLEKWVSQAAGGEPDFKSTRQLTVAQVPTAQDSRNRFHQIQLSANQSSWSDLPSGTTGSLDCIYCFLSTNTARTCYKSHTTNKTDTGGISRVQIYFQMWRIPTKSEYSQNWLLFTLEMNHFAQFERFSSPDSEKPSNSRIKSAKPDQ